MIADRIENLGKYESYESELGAVRAFLLENDPETLAPGRYEINGNVFVNVVAYAPGEAGGFEAHREYSDLQYVVSGDEEIDWIPLAETEDQAEYSAEERRGLSRRFTLRREPLRYLSRTMFTAPA